MKRETEANRPVILIRPHPPERLVRALARGEVAACCCCCCCCLHSIGGLAGAVVGTLYPSETSAPGAKPPPAKLRDEIDGPWRAAPAGTGAGRIYWISTLVASALTCLWALGFALGVKTWLAACWLLLAIFWPAIQLAGSFIALLIVQCHPDLSGDRAALKRLGRITLAAIMGAAIGMFVMVLMVITLSRR
jgi:hypothetical protein